MKHMAVWAIGLSLILATGFVDRDGDSYSLKTPRYAIVHPVGVLIVEGREITTDWTITSYSLDDILSPAYDTPSTLPSRKGIMRGKV